MVLVNFGVFIIYTECNVLPLDHLPPHPAGILRHPLQKKSKQNYKGKWEGWIIKL